MHSTLVFKVFVLDEYHLNKAIDKYMYFESTKCKWCVDELDKEECYGNHILFENYDIDWLFFMVIYISKVDSDLTPIRTILEV